MTNRAELLQVQRLTKRFDGLTAVNAVDLDVRQNEIVGLIGPNGAGKTTSVRHGDRLPQADRWQGLFPRRRYHADAAPTGAVCSGSFARFRKPQCFPTSR